MKGGLSTPSALKGVYAQPRNLLSPRYFKLIQDIRTFNRQALASLEEGMTLRDLLAKLKLGDWFQRRYLLAMIGAIWSTAPADMLDYPAATLLRFMDNHGLLSIWQQPEWRTVTGGSRAYVRRLEASLRARGVTIHCNAKVSAVQRDPKPTIARKGARAAEPFDAVIFACHADRRWRFKRCRYAGAPDTGGAALRPNGLFCTAIPRYAQAPRRLGFVELFRRF